MDVPYAEEYAPPRDPEVGTAAGQLRILGAAGGAYGDGVSVAAQGTIELMTTAWLGVRSSSLITVPLGNDPQLWSFRLGPSLHLFPYHRVDVGAFFDGGLALVNLTRSDHTAMPVIAAGGTIDVALSSFIVIHLEGLVQGGIASRAGIAQTYVNAVGLGGLGFTL
jgi:hypothetical protein